MATAHKGLGATKEVLSLKDLRRVGGQSFGFAFEHIVVAITLFGIGLLGEYIGRIYLQVRKRPKYLVDAVVETQQDQPDP